METINNYILSICFAIIFCIFAEAFTPSERYRGIIKIVSGVFVLYTFLMPVKGLLDLDSYNFEIPDISTVDGNEYKFYEDKTSEIFNETLRETSRQNLETDIRKTFEESDAVVEIDQNNSTITVSGIAHSDFDKISDYIENKYNFKALITE